MRHRELANNEDNHCQVVQHFRCFTFVNLVDFLVMLLLQVCVDISPSALFTEFLCQSEAWLLLHSRRISLVLVASCADVLSGVLWQMCCCACERWRPCFRAPAHAGVSAAGVCVRARPAGATRHCTFPQVLYDSNASKPLPVVSSNGF